MMDTAVKMETAIKKTNPWLAIWHRLRKNRLAIFGLVLLVFLIIVAVGAGFVLDFDGDVANENIRERLQPPSAAHWFGTDKYGRTVMIALTAGAIIAAVLAFNLIGDGLRDALDPRLKN